MNDRELAQVLAALRHWQQTVSSGTDAGFSHFESEQPMTHEEINDLCEDLNTNEGDG